MLSGRGATSFVALAAVLLLFVPPTTAAGAVAAEATATSYFDYFIGDLFQNPGKTDPKAPRFRPWRIVDVSGDGVLAFDCAGDVPTLRLLPRSDRPEQDVDSSNDGNPPPDTCGGGTQAGTPVQYKFSRPDKPIAVYSSLFWARPGGEEDEGNGAPLMPMPKLQLKAVLKALAAVMEAAWRGEKGEGTPDSVPFSADTVGFYVKYLGWLVMMGREDVEFREPWERLDGKVKALTVGPVV